MKIGVGVKKFEKKVWIWSKLHENKRFTGIFRDPTYIFFKNNRHYYSKNRKLPPSNCYGAGSVEFRRQIPMEKWEISFSKAADTADYPNFYFPNFVTR